MDGTILACVNISLVALTFQYFPSLPKAVGYLSLLAGHGSEPVSRARIATNINLD
jgi:hypothetical protein